MILLCLCAFIGSQAQTMKGGEITINVTGNIDINLDKAKLVGREGSVTFNRFPCSLSEFESVLPTLQQTPQGAVASQLMAMELYRRNRTDGEKAFRLCNVQSNVPMIMNRVPDLFGYTGGGGSSRPYQVASFLKGATPDNGYAPTLPYTIKVKVGANGAIYSNTYQAKVLYLQVATTGTDSGYRACEVINTKKPDEPKGWTVFNCPGLYVRCKDISFETPFGGLK